MCGIAGILYQSSPPSLAGEIASMTRLLAHRGPDGDGIYIDRQIALGHRRLAVLDVSLAGRQPMSYADKRYWITFNGEIYNFLELKRELNSLGHRFISETDTEVILAAYAQWGEACQLRFNGMWAFAIWDAREQSLFLSRDRFGVKPLYYTQQDDVFAFASELKAFLPLPWFKPQIDQSLLAYTLFTRNSGERSDNCLLRGVKRLGPGCSMTIRGSGKFNLQRWWNTLEHRPAVPQTFDEQVEQFRQIFFDACRIRMRSDVSLGTTLSGGLDSSAVVCAMNHCRKQIDAGERLAADWHKAVVACFPGASNDEREFAAAAVEHTETEALYRIIQPEEVVSTLEQVLFAAEEPNDNLSTSWLTYRELRRAGIVVSLDGHGGDELLAGYPWHVQAARIDAMAWPLEMRERQADLSTTLNSLFVGGKLPEPLPLNLTSWLRVLPAPIAYPGFDADSFALTGMDGLTRTLYFDYHYASLPEHLMRFDRCSMAHGIEMRAPFLDWRLACYCFALPADAKIGAGFTKRILRESMRGMLPEQVRTRKIKIGFATPLEDWLAAGSLSSFIQDTVNSKSFLESEISNGPVICRHVAQCLASGNLRLLRPVWGHIQAAYLIRLLTTDRWRDLLSN